MSESEEGGARTGPAAVVSRAELKEALKEMLSEFPAFQEFVGGGRRPGEVQEGEQRPEQDGGRPGGVTGGGQEGGEPGRTVEDQQPGRTVEDQQPGGGKPVGEK
jgi:hypothetical protein